MKEVQKLKNIFYLELLKKWHKLIIIKIIEKFLKKLKTTTSFYIENVEILVNINLMDILKKQFNIKKLILKFF